MDQSNLDDDEQVNTASVSSLAIPVNSVSAFKKMIQDFKKALIEKRTPRSLINLNWIIIAILLSSILVSSLEYYYQILFVNTFIFQTQSSLENEHRSAQFKQLACNFRSLINLANGLEDTNY